MEALQNQPVGNSLARIMADGWPALEQEEFGPWLLRASLGFTSRGNSVLVQGRPSRPLVPAVEAVEQWYAVRSLPAMLAVPTDASLVPWDLDLVDTLRERGYSPTQPTVTMTVAATALAAQAVSRAGEPSVEVVAEVMVDAILTPEWLVGFAAYRPLPDNGAPERILTGSEGQLFLTVPGHKRPQAVARMSTAPGWAGLHAMWVDPVLRRRGLATALAAKIGELAFAGGMAQVYLHVEQSNERARACYRSLGFGDHSGYVYYRQPG